MRTTIDLPDSLLRQVKARAALQGLTLKDLIANYVEQGLRLGTNRPEPQSRLRSPLPVIHRDGGKSLPALNNAELHQLLDDEDATDAWPR